MHCCIWSALVTGVTEQKILINFYGLLGRNSGSVISGCAYTAVYLGSIVTAPL